MSYLVSNSAYGYTVNTLVVVYISAKNSYGFGTCSGANTVGAKVRTIPKAPLIPTTGLIATDTQVSITWSQLTFGADTGLVAITSYNLYSDNGSGGTTFNEVFTGLSLSYLATGLTGGGSYIF